MNFICECGYRINDTTDYLSYKAHFISDQDWFDFIEKIESIIEKPALSAEDKTKEMMEIRNLASRLENIVYQCPKCGNVFFSEKNPPSLEIFRGSSNEVNKKLFKSALRDEWQGFLYGDWIDEPPEWWLDSSNGYISASCLTEIKRYNDWQSLEKDYYELFSYLNNKHLLRSSVLEKNNVKIHTWNLKTDD